LCCGVLSKRFFEHLEYSSYPGKGKLFITVAYQLNDAILFLIALRTGRFPECSLTSGVKAIYVDWHG
jgi:hypothetical protein